MVGSRLVVSIFLARFGSGWSVLQVCLVAGTFIEVYASPPPSPAPVQYDKQPSYVPPEWLADFLRMDWLRDFLGFEWVDDVLSSPVWAGISGLASLLALTAIVLALLDFRARKRRVEGVHWEVESHGQGTLPESARPRHLEILKLTQAGSSAVRIYSWSIVEGAAYRDETYDMPWHMKPGDTVQVAIQTAAPEKSWFLLVWMDLTDSRWFSAEWFPLAENGEGTRLDEKRRSHEATTPKSRWLFWRRRVAAQPVGPTAAGRVRFSTNPKSLKKDYEKVLGLVSNSQRKMSVMPGLRQIPTPVASSSKSTSAIESST